LALADVKNIANGLYCSPTLPVCFIGERRTPSGTRRLIVIQLQAKQLANVSATNNTYTAQIATTRLLYATSFRLGDETSPPDRMGHWELELLLPESRLTRSVTTDQWQEHRGGNITLLAGQADEKDTSHILIPYRRDGKDGVIDAWLRDEGILLKPREGRLADTPSGLRAWQLDAVSDAKTP
jgi:hypothetical protein